jgi:hypothetical protein
MKSSLKALLVAAVLLCIALPFARRAYAMAQITMVNRTSVQLTLYIDGNYGCGPAMPNGLYCTSSITAGEHTLTAQGSNGQSISRTIVIQDGSSPTWTICYADDTSPACKDSD